MFKALIVGGAKENHHFKFLACKSVVHHLVSESLVSKFVQLLADAVYSLTLERRCVSLIAV
jgi:hypothetical protein